MTGERVLDRERAAETVDVLGRVAPGNALPAPVTPPPHVELRHEVLVVYDSPGDDSITVVNDVRQIYPELRGIQNTLGSGVVNAIRAGNAHVVTERASEFLKIVREARNSASAAA